MSGNPSGSTAPAGFVSVLFKLASFHGSGNIKKQYLSRLLRQVCVVDVMKKPLAIIAMFIAAADWIACKEEQPATGFEFVSGSGTEGDSVYSVNIHLGQITGSTQINFSVAGTAALDGDFTVGSVLEVKTDSGFTLTPNYSSSASSSLTLTALPGQSEVTLRFKVIDDTYVEPQSEIIYFQIASISNGGVSIDRGREAYEFTLRDNDDPPAEGLQVDLSWLLANDVSINQANFDMYLLRNVILNSAEEIVEAERVDGFESVRTQGFESFTLSDNLPDEEYYILIRYKSGNQDANVYLIMSQDGSYSRAAGRVMAEQTGQDLFYGPIVKNGSSYSRSRTAEPRWHKIAN